MLKKSKVAKNLKVAEKLPSNLWLSLYRGVGLFTKKKQCNHCVYDSLSGNCHKH